MQILDAAATAQALPWQALLAALRRTLADQTAGLAQVPARQVLALAPQTRWFVMPSWLVPALGDLDPNADLAAIKLITWAAGNPALGLPSILGDVLVLRASTGQRLALLDGPTVTARRTAAVTVLAVQTLLGPSLAAQASAGRAAGPLLVIGTGVQALAHVQALVACLGVREVWLRGRTPARSRTFAQALLAVPGLANTITAMPADDLPAALQRCPLVVTATPAQAPCLFGPLRADTLVAAIGAFTPAMIELDPALSRHIANTGRVVLDSADARHEAGDLLAAGVDTSHLPTLADLLAAPQAQQPGGPVLFKSCGHALWDLAAARCAAGLLV